MKIVVMNSCPCEHCIEPNDEMIMRIFIDDVEYYLCSECFIDLLMSNKNPEEKEQYISKQEKPYKREAE